MICIRCGSIKFHSPTVYTDHMRYNHGIETKTIQKVPKMGPMTKKEIIMSIERMYEPYLMGGNV